MSYLEDRKLGSTQQKGRNGSGLAHAEADGYETVAASQSDQVLGTTGAAGDLLQRLIITVDTALTGTVSIKDVGGSAIPITAANTPIGVYVVDLDIISTGAGWSVTTGAGASVIGIGSFT